MLRMSQPRGKSVRRGGTGNGAEGTKGKGGLAAWQIALLLLAVLVMAAGLAIGILGADDPASAGAPGGPIEGPVRGLAPIEPGDEGGAAASEDGVRWSPVVFRLGFSAFVGFAVGYALRSFLKLSLFALGFFFLMLFGLEYAQIIEIHWGAMEQRYDEASTWLGAQTRGFVAFVTGQLPAAGLGVAGLVTGLKRR